MAERHKAAIAINAGFFEIGGDSDGDPSFTLVIDGKIYQKTQEEQPLLMINSGNLSIELSEPSDADIDNVSMVSGSPILVENGEIFPKLVKKRVILILIYMHELQ